MLVPTSHPLVQGAQALLSPAALSQTSKISRAATDFEALLLQQMLRSARESRDEDSDDSSDGSDNSSLMELGEQQFAKTLANSGGLGIAKMVVAGLSTNANR